MKKTILALAILFSSLTANAQFFPFRDVNFGHFGLGIMGGAVGLGKQPTLGTFGINLMGYGVYLDFNYHGPEHRHTAKIAQWNDNEGFSVHMGYQIPIVEFVRILPVIGYAQISTGITDGLDYSTSYDSKSRSWVVNNKYNKQWQSGGFDAGGGLVFNIGPVNVFVIGTMSSVYGGVGVEF